MKLRGRPKKLRTVKKEPKITQFSPRGRPGRPNEVDLNIDEFEAIRLADYLGWSQKRASESMNISQQTFSRIIKRARVLIAEALVKGNIIRIQGVSYAVKSFREF